MIPAVPCATAPAAAPRAGVTPAGPSSFGAVLERCSAPGGVRAEWRDPAPAVFPAGGPCSPPSAGAALLEVVDRARARLEGVLAAARSGRTFTAQELLGLQAEAYRTVQTVDLGVKLVEQGAQAVRQTLATQV